MAGKNYSRLKTLNKIAEHEAVEEIYKDEDGIWVYLTDEWVWDGCYHTIHEDTVKEVLSAFKTIKRVES